MYLLWFYIVSILKHSHLKIIRIFFDKKISNFYSNIFLFALLFGHLIKDVITQGGGLPNKTLLNSAVGKLKNRRSFLWGIVKCKCLMTKGEGRRGVKIFKNDDVFYEQPLFLNIKSNCSLIAHIWNIIKQ